MKNYLERTIAPRVRADGGWLEWAAEDDETLTLTARGECAQCKCLDKCLDWVRARIRRDLGVDRAVRAVREPFIWRK